VSNGISSLATFVARGMPKWPDFLFLDAKGFPQLFGKKW